MNDELKCLILRKVFEKNQFKGLKLSFAINWFEKIERQNQNLVKSLEKEFTSNSGKFEKNKYLKQFVKLVREEFGQQYGQFLTSKYSKIRNMSVLNMKEEDLQSLLKYHKSSRERFDFYDEIYSKIFSWYKPQRIADMGCGLNPLSYVFIQKYCEPEYFGSDLNEEDMKFLESVFTFFNFKGKFEAYDLTGPKVLYDEDLQNSDMVFLFKALDSVERQKRHFSKEILSKINAKHIVVSFPTQSLVAGKEFDLKKRSWLVKFIEKENWKYEVFNVENEMFFLITKN